MHAGASAERAYRRVTPRDLDCRVGRSVGRGSSGPLLAKALSRQYVRSDVRHQRADDQAEEQQKAEGNQQCLAALIASSAHVVARFKIWTVSVAAPPGADAVIVMRWRPASVPGHVDW